LFEKPLRSFSRFGLQDAQTSLLPLWKKGVDVLASPCVSSAVSGIRTLKLPLLPVWGKGAGGMRGKRRGNAENHIIMQAGVASIVSSWLSSPPVASNAGWKPAHPGSGEQPASCAGCGLETRAPWQFRQDAAGIESRPKFISVAVWGHDSGSVQPYLIDSTSMGTAIDARWHPDLA
jgi:hypothetical protein